MLASWSVVLAALVYLCFLFAIAHWGDVAGRRLMRGNARPTIYALALAVYCTSWTFYGSVGQASRSGLDFLAIYVGPILVVGLGTAAVARVVRIAKTQNSTSVADFVASRYGKSEGVAAIVCLIGVVGSLPYIALQLKAVGASLSTILRGIDPATASTGIAGVDLVLVVALVLAGFAAAFGTRHADATEHQNGLVLAIAVESIVKLLAFLAVGAVVTFVMFSGVRDVFARATEAGVRPLTLDWPSFLVTALLAGAASLLLPRQFHMMVVENRAVTDLRRAAWLFPLYLVAINLFVVPLALAGLQVLPEDGVNRDMTVLLLPLARGHDVLALLVFIGGLSAATAMVIVDTVALSVMVSNHLVMPLILRRHVAGAAPFGTADLGGVVLAVRRIAILAITLLGYLYVRFSQDADLSEIGLLSFAAIVQIAPSFVGGLVWRRGTAFGAGAGLIAGLLAWGWTLFLPAVLGPGGALPSGGLVSGTLWSLGLNVAAYVLFSLQRPVTALERLQASVFVGEADAAASPTHRLLRSTVTVEELRNAVGRFIGADRTRRSFASFARSRAMVLDDGAEADIHLLRYAEHLLASAIGGASSRLALSLVLRRRNLSPRAALRLLDEASAALQYNRDLLQHALDHSQQGITIFDRDLRLLGWNQAFIELYTFPPELVRIGVGLDEILRTNARRGTYGPGSVEELVGRRLNSMLHEPGPIRVKLHTTGRVISVRTNHLPGGGLVATYTDVTGIVASEEARERENETLEQRVRERTEELTRLNAELTRAKGEAEAANASKTRFLAAASHDILQPLNAARLYATALVERTGEGEPARLAENVDASLDAVEEILTTLLDISRLDSGAMKPEWAAVPVAELFQQLSRDYGPMAREKGLELDFVRSSLWVRSDRGMLRRLLQNLVSNAVKYTPRGRVLVGVRRHGDQARFEVWDTGLGIPASQQKAIFSEFRRLSQGIKAAQGLGLGLSIVERIAKTLDVPVELASELDRGSVFRIEVPITKPEPVRSPVRRGAAPASAPLTGLAVLAIDNEPAVLQGMETLLSGWGCDVAVAASRDAALAAVALQPPRIIVADYHLDEGTGVEAIAAVRDALGIPLPAVLVTADNSPELRDETARRDIRLLNKPLKPAALRALLTQLLAPRIAAE